MKPYVFVFIILFICIVLFSIYSLIVANRKINKLEYDLRYNGLNKEVCAKQVKSTRWSAILRIWALYILFFVSFLIIVFIDTTE